MPKSKHRKKHKQKSKARSERINNQKKAMEKKMKEELKLSGELLILARYNHNLPKGPDLKKITEIWGENFRFMTVHRAKGQEADYVLLVDLISGILMMMELENFSGPINLGNPSEISIIDLASEIIDLTGSKSKIVNHKMPEDDPKQRCPDIKLAKKQLNWIPKFERNEGLRKTISYFENLLRAEKK
mgnify:CR=1 FL=1